MNEPTYPIAETFISPQGEGAYVGAAMLFIRLAGCNVGKYMGPMELTAEDESGLKDLRVLNPKHSICTSAIGNKKFLCDTDYFKRAAMTPFQLIAEATTVRRICITGGEPLMHDLMPLVRAALIKKIDVHIETSGTLPITKELADMCWITCSPKAGFLTSNRPMIREYKFVVDPAAMSSEETIKQIRELTGGLHSQQLFYIQSINGVNELNHESNAGLLAIQRLEPRLRISIQTHKILGVR